jgi:hypothetical protein
MRFVSMMKSTLKSVAARLPLAGPLPDPSADDMCGRVTIAGVP